MKIAEKQRLAKVETQGIPWKKWGPYLAERQWGTVREDYSADGDAWRATTHDMARSKAYRWGEEGIGGICDDRQRLCLAVALWNGHDPMLKERLFGLSGHEGNHGEDVKEIYYYLDNTPTHSYMKMLYKYPQAEFPYARLIEENRRRGRDQPEFEIIDTGVFADGRYFDVFIEYAKNTPEDILVRLRVINRGPEPAPVWLLPQVWFRNTWDWEPGAKKPQLRLEADQGLQIQCPVLGSRWLYCDGQPEWLFCDNETNSRRLYGDKKARGYFKDGINDYLVAGKKRAINPRPAGTKAAARYDRTLAPGEQMEIRLRLNDSEIKAPFADFDAIFARRFAEAEAFYADLQHNSQDAEATAIQRQAYAGMLWTKQFYYYDVSRWLQGDPGQPPPPPEHQQGRNSDWTHLNNADIISMPDTWEYPWYAAWDLAFHCLPLARLDASFAKEQLVLLTREWYMHPNGQLPAYEWHFSDVNPPVHAWATWRVYNLDREQNGGHGDRAFLERVFHKLLLNFTWWVNQKDEDEHNIFQGGFLGLDNIGVFDRSSELPTGGHLEQADGTGWMAMYCLNMMRIALELAQENAVYEDLATKFFEHFLYIAHALANFGGDGLDLWDETDEFYYDLLHCPDGKHVTLRIRSIIGLIPLFAVETLEPDFLERVPQFQARLEWFLRNRPQLAALVSRWYEPGFGERRLLSLLRGHRMKKVLKRMLDETEFLSEHGVRSLSRYHLDHPYEFHAADRVFRVAYLPAESDSGMFGGNSNWRGPIWFPINFLLIESLLKFHNYYGNDFKVEYPTGSGVFLTLEAIARELARRLVRLFRRDSQGRRPALGQHELLQNDPHFRDYLLFHEYFHGDNGCGLGASHQTGWTGLVAELLELEWMAENPAGTRAKA